MLAAVRRGRACAPPSMQAGPPQHSTAGACLCLQGAARRGGVREHGLVQSSLQQGSGQARRQGCVLQHIVADAQVPLALLRASTAAAQAGLALHARAGGRGGGLTEWWNAIAHGACAAQSRRSRPAARGSTAAACSAPRAARRTRKHQLRSPRRGWRAGQQGREGRQSPRRRACRRRRPPAAPQSEQPEWPSCACGGQQGAGKAASSAQGGMGG